MNLAQILYNKVHSSSNKLPTWLQSGDKIKCILNGSGFTKDEIYTFDYINGCKNIVVKDVYHKGGGCPYRFQKVDN